MLLLLLLLLALLLRSQRFRRTLIVNCPAVTCCSLTSHKYLHGRPQVGHRQATTSKPAAA
jgi:hypothetical protein